MSETTEIGIANGIAFALIMCMIGCATTGKDFSKIPEYNKEIKLITYPSGEKSFNTKLTLWKFINTKYDSKLNYKDNLLLKVKKENEVRKLVKDEGLYINKLEYVEDKHGDTYLICEASEKPTFREDWQEHKKHREIYEYILLQKKYGTNTTLKCNCRYCTSGLDRKYWY